MTSSRPYAHGLPVSCPFTRRFFQDRHAIRLSLSTEDVSSAVYLFVIIVIIVTKHSMP